MAGSFNPNYNPAQVMLSKDGTQNVGPYLNTQARTSPKADTTKPQGNVLGAQAVRATGPGPFDPSYRQDIATYGGGNFARPGGSLSFNPTGAPFGQQTGAGSAPVPGMPTDMLTSALGGAPFSFGTPQPPSQTFSSGSTKNSQQKPWWQNWRGDLPILR